MLGFDFWRWAGLWGATLSLLSACSDDASLGSNEAETSGTDAVSGTGTTASDASNSTSATSATTGSGGTGDSSSASGNSASSVGGAATNATTSAGASGGVGGARDDTSSAGGSGGSSGSGGTGGAATGGTGGGAATSSGGAGGDATSTTGVPACETSECLRPYECAVSCDAAATYVGCCPCDNGLIDQFVECTNSCQDGDTMKVDCNSCDCVAGRWSCTEIACACGGDTCATGEYCAEPAGMCDAASDSGSCAMMPEGCTAEYAPVCGCDGATYDNACAAAAAGVNVDTTGACATN